MSNEKSISKHTKAISYLLGFISFVLFVYILMALKEILIPITIAIFLTFLFHPLLNYLGKYKVPKWLALILILILISSLYYLLGLLIVSNYPVFVENLQGYSANLSLFLQNILKPFDITLKELASMLNLKDAKFDLSSIFQSLFNAGVVQGVFNSLTGMLGDFFISLIFWMFMMLGKNKFEERLKFAFEERREMVESNIESINTQLQSYIVIKTILSIITGFIATIILLIYGIDFAIIWGVLTFILNFIPNIGSLIATVAPILVALLEYGFGFRTVSLAVLLVLSHNIIGNIAEPHYLGRRMDLSPVFVLFSLIFWGWIWGIVGMFLAVPIAASMKIFFSNFEALKPIAILMGSKAQRLENENGLTIK